MSRFGWQDAMRRSCISSCDAGQALVETALVLPILMTLILNCVNLGYFFLVALNVTATPRSSAEYSIMGFSAPDADAGVPAVIGAGTASTVAYLAYQDMRGALGSYANAQVQICSKKLGYNNAGTSTQTAQCSTCTSSSDSSCNATNSYTPSSDPESPTFVLHRVDVAYTFNTLISGTGFNLALLPASLCSGNTCTIHRQISMRAMD